MLREIGSGQFGCVYEGKWNNAHQVAVKQLKKGMMDSADFLREAKIMKTLRHQNLIQLYAVGESNILTSSKFKYRNSHALGADFDRYRVNGEWRIEQVFTIARRSAALTKGIVTLSVSRVRRRP